MIERRTVLSVIEVVPPGIIQVRFEKQLVENGVVLSSQYHRTAIEPGVSLEDQMAFVNAHLQLMGEAVISEYALLTDCVSGVHTQARIAAHRQQVAGQSEEKEK